MTGPRTQRAHQGTKTSRFLKSSNSQSLFKRSGFDYKQAVRRNELVVNHPEAPLVRTLGKLQLTTSATALEQRNLRVGASQKKTTE